MRSVDTAGSQQIYHRRRQRIGATIGNGALILAGGEEKVRSHDTHYRFRPDSNFHYLIGLSEPGAVAVFRPSRDPQLVLFVRPRDPDAEVWTGRRIGPEGACRDHGADVAYPLETLHEHLPELLEGVHEVHLPWSRPSSRLERDVRTAIEQLHRSDRHGKIAPTVLRDAREILGEDRVVKDADAIASLRHAVDITVDAHLTAMRRVRPGMHEYEIEAILEYCFRRRGSTGPGYGSIVAGGDNANILHYVDNVDPLRAGDVLLVDAGAEWDFFSGDLTRSYPVTGKFTPAQRELYELVLAANCAGIEDTRVGNDIDGIHRKCVRILCQGLVDLGLLDGDVDGIIEREEYKRYYMHRTSHWLGADVHDAGHYSLDRKPRPLQPGFVLTIEPALYIPADDEQAPAAMRGCGIRIEDDVLVRESGPEVLTHRAPKRIAELEDIVGSEAGAPLDLPPA